MKMKTKRYRCISEMIVPISTTLDGIRPVEFVHIKPGTILKQKDATINGYIILEEESSFRRENERHGLRLPERFFLALCEDMLKDFFEDVEEGTEDAS